LIEILSKGGSQKLLQDSIHHALSETISNPQIKDAYAKLSSKLLALIPIFYGSPQSLIEITNLLSVLLTGNEIYQF
jgi:hypothetical protein